MVGQKPHNKQDSRRVQKVKETNLKSVCGCAVEIVPLSGPSQLSALTASDVQAVKNLCSVQRSIGWSLLGQLPFLSVQI